MARAGRRELLWGGAGLVLGILAVLAGRTVLLQASPGPTVPPATVLYQVVGGTVGRDATLRAHLAWTLRATIYAPASGTVTESAPQARPITEGDVLLRIDEVPTVAVASDVPFYRDLGPGDTGRDVASLNRFLAGRGLVVDAASSLYSSRTAGAVSRWHRSVGQEARPTLRVGELLGLPPASLGSSIVVAAHGIEVGAIVGRGQPLFLLLSDAPSWVVSLGSSPPAGLAEGTAGTAALPGGPAPVAVTGLSSGPEGGMVATLSGAGGPPCRADGCPPPAGDGLDATVPVTLVLVRSTTGSLVPVMAIETDAGGGTFVVRRGGARLPVQILAAANGQAIVSGVSPGDQLEIP